MLADKGFSGKDLPAATAAHGIEFLRPDRKDETYRNGNLGGVHPRRSTTPGDGRWDLAQLGHRSPSQTLPDRLRLPTFKESSI